MHSALLPVFAIQSQKSAKSARLMEDFFFILLLLLAELISLELQKNLHSPAICFSDIAEITASRSSYNTMACQRQACEGRRIACQEIELPTGNGSHPALRRRSVAYFMPPLDSRSACESL